MELNEKKPVFELLIQTDPTKIVELESATGRVCMIPFCGVATGSLFHGIIEPCGVDTQITNAAGVRHMSARYMLTGEDHTGASCHIFIQNEACLPMENVLNHGTLSQHSSQILKL